MPWRTDLDKYRARRTLSEVKRKLEEALRLSRIQNGNWSLERTNGEPTATHRHR